MKEKHIGTSRVVSLVTQDIKQFCTAKYVKEK